MLVQAGWAVQDAKAVNLYAKQGVAIREVEFKFGFGAAYYLFCKSIDLTPTRSFIDDVNKLPNRITEIYRRLTT